MSEKHPMEEIRKVIEDADAVHVSTLAGGSIRSRMMHFGLGGGFDVYLASMKADPKTVQVANNRNITLLFRKAALDERDSAEVEIGGLAELVKNEDERQKGFRLEAPRSSIVRGLVESGNTRVLDCIKVRPLHIKYRVFREIVAGISPTVYEFPQHAEAVSDWSLLWRKAKLWAAEIRAPFLTGSVLPMILGAMIAYTQNGMFDWWLFLLAFLSGVFIHLSANVFNDYYDHRSRNDEVNKEFVRPFSGGSRMIQLGLMTPLEVLAEAVLLATLAGVIGLYLAWLRGWPIIVFGLIGLLSGYFYTAPPFNIASRGVGELFVGINFGVLMTLGSYYVQAMTLSWTAFVASLPMAFLIAAILYVNEFPDYKADMAVGKKHLVVRMGRERAVWGVHLLFLFTFLAVVIGAFVGLLPLYVLVALLAAPFAIKASLYCARFHSSSFDMVPANAATIMTHMFTGILLVAGFGFTKLESVGLGYVALVVAILAAMIGFIYWSSSRKEAAMAGVKRAMA